MGPLAKTAAVLAIVSLQASCVRFELEGDTETEIDVGSKALRISGEDSVVLCPLAASLEPAGNVSIVWAGYPAADDRLQLMHARVSSSGALIQDPRGLALLNDELALLSFHALASGIEVHAVQRDANETLRIDLSDNGQVLGSSRDVIHTEEQDGALDALGTEHCEHTVFTGDARLQIRRTHVDGELPLFVESFPL